MKSRRQAEAINQAINRYLYRINGLYHQAAKWFGLSYTELLVYYYLDDQTPRSLRELTWLCGLSKQTLHSCLKKMEAGGLVESAIPRSSRCPLYTLSPAGFQMVHPIISRIRQAEIDAITRLSGVERSVLEQTLDHHWEQLEKTFERLQQEGARPAGLGRPASVSSSPKKEGTCEE